MDYSAILLPLALILIFSKVLTKLCERLSLPGVVGMLAAGLLIGLIRYIPGQSILTAEADAGIGLIAKIGVVLIMFSAGLETDLKQIKAVGLPALVVTAGGVVLPMALGFTVACAFGGGFAGLSREALFSNLFYGVILTATSVSVSVATLKEIGKLSTKLGGAIITAAILDDIIGIVVLSVVIGLSEGGSGGGGDYVHVFLMTLLFFVAAAVAGVIIHRLFKWLDAKYPHHRLIPVLSVAVCFFFAYASEEWFGVADITGAFAAGLILSRNPDSRYIDRRSDIMSYMMFTPIFFASIGITADFSGLTPSFALFGACFILAGMAGKVIGCGGLARACGFSGRDSLRIGIGMMARAEVALVSAQKGVEHGLIDANIMPFIVIMIILTSFTTPILLKSSYNRENRATKTE